MTLEDWDDLNARFHEYLGKIELLPQFAQRDCRRMSQTVRDLLRSADQERVICRRRNYITPQFSRVMSQAQEALTNFESHVILALLLKEKP